MPHDIDTLVRALVDRQVAAYRAQLDAKLRAWVDEHPGRRPILVPRDDTVDIFDRDELAKAADVANFGGRV